MKVNKKINSIKYVLAIVWCAGFLLLGGCSETEESTWKQEYENCMAAMEQGIAERGMAGQQEQDVFKREAWNWAVGVWQDSLSAFGECVEICIRNQPEGMDWEEDIYRTATLLMAAMCEEHNGSYEFAYEHGEDLEKIRKDFRAVIEGSNPIDESINSFHEDFGIYYYADTLISGMMAEAWEKEFRHCLDMVENEVRLSASTGEEQALEILETYEDFFGVWADNERESRAEVFRIGTMLLVNGLKQSGGSYEFIYDGEADREELRHICEGTEADAGAGRRYPYTNPVDQNVGFLARENENPENSVPEELTEELSTALQNNTLEDYVAEISAEYVLLQENEIMQYIRKDTSGVLESFYYEYIEGGEEWFLFGRDNDIIVRQKIDNEKYPYCYYKFPCEGGVYEAALRAYGKNEDYYFISWEDDDYLLVTKRAEGQVNGLAVYQMYGYALIGWILGLEKTSDGGVEVTYNSYVSNGNYIRGERFLDY